MPRFVSSFVDLEGRVSDARLSGQRLLQLTKRQGIRSVLILPSSFPRLSSWKPPPLNLGPSDWQSENVKADGTVCKSVSGCEDTLHTKDEQGLVKVREREVEEDQRTSCQKWFS